MLVPEAALSLPRIEVIDKFHFEIVKGCQLRCVGCPNSTLRPTVQRIDVDDFDECLRNVDVAEVRYLRLFAFGEPLLHHNLAGILGCIRVQRWKVGRVEISTNAQHADWEDLEAAIKSRVLTTLAVSCDGDGTPQQYEALRPPSRWERLLEFLERARSLRDRHDPALQLMTRTICPDAQGQARWTALLEPLGWKPEFRGWLYLPESAVNMTGRTPRIPRRVCSFQQVHDRLYVDWDGSVVPCCAHPRAGMFGNLHVQRFSEIVRGRRRAEMLERMASDRAAMPICGSCEF
ncbi:MAG: SPASM domain-containing protein [Betaproteobacteria bacterium]|nr:SPASM domain-containing protein [Betaproteobacteria bacterium]